MTPGLIRAAQAQIGRGEPWVVIHQHRVHTRIADLVVARIDIDALERRLADVPGRSLTMPELMVFRGLRVDSGTSLGRLVGQLNLSEESIRKAAARLLRDGFADQTRNGGFVRAVSREPVVDRLISFEAKRADARGAFLQARAHGLFANRSFVAFDRKHEKRFQAFHRAFDREGIGLLGLAREKNATEVVLPARRSSNWRAFGMALGAERAFSRLLGESITPLPETRLRGELAPIAGQLQLLGRPTKPQLRQLSAISLPLRGLEPSPAP